MPSDATGASRPAPGPVRIPTEMLLRRPTRGLWFAATLTALAALTSPGVAHAWEARFPGGQYEHRVAGGQDYHLLKVDLCAAGIHLRGTRPAEKGQTVSHFGANVGAAAAINGDFFDHDFGLNVGDGRPWPYPDTDHSEIGRAHV